MNNDSIFHKTSVQMERCGGGSVTEALSVMHLQSRSPCMQRQVLRTSTAADRVAASEAHYPGIHKPLLTINVNIVTVVYTHSGKK